MTDKNKNPAHSKTNSDATPKVTGIGGIFFFSEMGGKTTK